MAHYQYYHSTIIVIYANDLWWLPFTLIHKNLGNATERWFGPFSKHRLILFSWKEISGVWRKKNKFPFTFLGLWLRLSVIKDRLIRKMNRNVVTCAGFLGGAVVKKSTCQAGDERDTGSIPWSGRSLGKGNGNPLQYSCLESSTDIGAWQATVHRVTKSVTWLSDWARMHTYIPPVHMGETQEN